jgi:RNA 2',3'-cyclic 3'-phosphodiesterase
METEIRSFIAIELSEDARKALGIIQDSIKKPYRKYLKWVSPSSIHLTLKFLGNIKPDKIDGITEAVKKSCAGINRFDLQITGLGVFPNPKAPRVLWANLKGDIDTLIKLQQLIDDNLLPLGFTREKRPFSPHLTLARINDSAGPQERTEIEIIVSNDINTAITSIHVEAVSLMRSTLLPTGAVYTQLANVPL